MDLAVRREEVVFAHRVARGWQSIMPALEGPPPGVFLWRAVARARREVHGGSVGIHDGDHARRRRCAELVEQVADVTGDAVDVEIDVDLAEVRRRDVPIQVFRTADELLVDTGAAARWIKDEVAVAV